MYNGQHQKLLPTVRFMLFLRSLLLTSLCALAAIVPRAYAADRPDVLTIKKSSVGFGGKLKAGFWQPVRLTIVAGDEGARGSLQLVVPDGDQVPVIYRDDARRAIDLNPGQEQTVLLYAKSGPIDAP